MTRNINNILPAVGCGLLVVARATMVSMAMASVAGGIDGLCVGRLGRVIACHGTGKGT